MGLLRHHPSIGKLPCEGYDWRLSHLELDALIWREGEELAPRRGPPAGEGAERSAIAISCARLNSPVTSAPFSTYHR
jgi:hypothetical protein